MEDGQGLSATWSAHSDLPHRSREGCDHSLTECHKSARDHSLADNLTGGSEATHVLLRPCSLIARRAKLYRPPGNSRRLGALLAGGMRSDARAPWVRAVVQFLRQSLLSPCAAPPTSPFMALLTGSLPALFVCLWLRPLLLFCEAAQSSADRELRGSDR